MCTLDHSDHHITVWAVLKWCVRPTAKIHANGSHLKKTSLTEPAYIVNTTFRIQQSSFLLISFKICNYKKYSIQSPWFTSYYYYYYSSVPSVLWRCWLGGRKGIRPVKNWVMGYWREWVADCLEWVADLHMAQLMPLPLTVSCFSKIQIGFPFWHRLTRVVPDKGPLNVCVCVCVIIIHQQVLEQGLYHMTDVSAAVCGPIMLYTKDDQYNKTVWWLSQL